MDKEKQIINAPSLTIPAPENKIYETILKDKDSVKESDLLAPKTDLIKDLFDQKKNQREKVLNSILTLLWASFWLLASLIIIQSMVRSFVDKEFSIIEIQTLNILAVSIFGQTVAVVYVISKSLWDDKIYSDFMGNSNPINKSI